MSRLVALLVLLAVAAGCESRTEYGECVPVDQSHERPDLEYRISVRNAVLGVIFVEMIFPPIIVLAAATYCPTGPKAVRP